MTEEQAIIQRAQNGEITAFRDLVDLYKKKIYYLSLDLTGNHSDAEDLSQEVFIKAYQNINDFRGDAKFSSWLYRITVNTNINQFRKKSYQARKVQQSLEKESQEMNPMLKDEQSTNPEQFAESSLTQQYIQKALNKLSSRERSVFVLRHYHDLPLNEIGQTLKITSGTVKSTLFRALKKLQKELSFYRYEPDLEALHE